MTESEGKSSAIKKTTVIACNRFVFVCLPVQPLDGGCSLALTTLAIMSCQSYPIHPLDVTWEEAASKGDNFLLWVASLESSVC